MPVTVFPIGPFRRMIAGTSILDPCSKPLGAQSLATVCGPTKLRWYDASQETYTDGQSVATIHDKSGNADDATQGNAAFQATFRTTLGTGGPVFNFTANTVGYLTSSGAASTSMTIHAVVRYRLGQTSEQFGDSSMFSSFAIGGGFDIALDGGPATPVGAFISAGGGGGGSKFAPAVCGWQVLSFVLDKVNGVFLYRAGVLLASTSTAATVNAPTQFALGDGSGGAGNGAVMQLAELQLIASARSATQVASDAACLKTKWGIPS